MKITKLGIYKMRDGGEARVAAIEGDWAHGLFYSGHYRRTSWHTNNGAFTHVMDEHQYDLVELVKEWEEK